MSMFKKMKEQLQALEKLNTNNNNKKKTVQEGTPDALTAREQKKQVKDKKDPKEKEKKKKKNKEDKTIESPPKEKDKRKDEDPKQAVMKKKKKGSRTKEGKEKVTREDQSQMPTVSAPSTQSREDQVKVSTKWCDAISDKGVDQLVKEFKQINEQSVDMGSEKSENADKSRRKDLPCLEETRVKLDKDEFIHANYIQAICSSTRFIMTQHPLPHTMDTFWRMIHKERVDAIIMLNEVSADCPTYIPSAVGIARSFGEIKVTLNEQAPLSPEFPFIIQSKLQIQRKPKDENVKPDPKSDEYDKRKFKHLQWTNWPKNSVPEVSNALESLLTSIRNSSKPIVVHCTDGASRSGVVVLAELYFEAITMGQGSTDTADMLKRLREQRARAIGNEAQHIYAHRVVMHYFVSQNNMDLTQTLLIFIDDYDSFVKKHNAKIAEEESKGTAQSDSPAPKT